MKNKTPAHSRATSKRHPQPTINWPALRRVCREMKVTQRAFITTAVNSFVRDVQTDDTLKENFKGLAEGGAK
jgi:hypothetical protein